MRTGLDTGRERLVTEELNRGLRGKKKKKGGRVKKKVAK